MQKRNFYGGAITLQLPSQFADVSEFRQVPDHQEVFADAATDSSVICEIVEAPPARVPDAQAPMYYFRDLAQVTNASQMEIFEQGITTYCSHLPSTHVESKLYIVGRMRIAKFKETAGNLVDIFLLILRLPRYQSDILITFNFPVEFSPQSSSTAQSCTLREASQNRQLISTVVDSFQITNYDLFG